MYVNLVFMESKVKNKRKWSKEHWRRSKSMIRVCVRARVCVNSDRGVFSTVRPVRLRCLNGLWGKKKTESTLVILFHFVDMVQKGLSAFIWKWRKAKKDKKVQDDWNCFCLKETVKAWQLKMSFLLWCCWNFHLTYIFSLETREKAQK